jgi:hypothetical protein
LRFTADIFEGMKKALLMTMMIAWTTIMFNACGKSENNNPDVPVVNIYLSIDPNSTLFLELNAVGGWIYLDEVPGVDIRYPSRGIIVYRQDVTLFKAYERQPPNAPFQCCDANQNCTKLIVGDNYPFVKDTCTETMYSLLDGTIFSGEGQFPLIQYNAFYDGGLLHISN